MNQSGNTAAPKHKQTLWEKYSEPQAPGGTQADLDAGVETLRAFVRDFNTMKASPPDQHLVNASLSGLAF